MTNVIIKADPALGAAPTVNTDETLGYNILSEVFYNGKVYKCRDATTGAAIWSELPVVLDVVTNANAAVSLAHAHHNCKLRLTHATPVLTIPPQASETFQDGHYTEVVFVNAGQLVGGAAVAVNGATAETFTVAARPNRIAIERLASNNWEVTGGMEVAP